MSPPKMHARNGLLKTGAVFLVILSVIVAAVALLGLVMNIVDTTDYAIDELERGGYPDYKGLALDISALEAVAARLIAGSGFALGLAAATGYVAHRFVAAGEPWALGLTATAWLVAYPFAYLWPLVTQPTPVTASWAGAVALLLLLGLGLSWMGLKRAEKSEEPDAATDGATA